MRRICVVTGSRAEYGLLYWTIKRLHEDSNFELILCVTGMHLSLEFGLTYKQIEEDGFIIDEKIELLLSSDTRVGISKSIGLGVISFAEMFNRKKPDLLLILGDRFEILAATIAAMVANLPIAHCHGGEITEGAIDDAIRHSITKMSHLHFASTEEYKKRIIQLGESPERVYNVGALGIENINKLKLLEKVDFESSINAKLQKFNFLITYHPETLGQKEGAEFQFKQLLNALEHHDNTLFIFTKPNADSDGRIIGSLIDQFVLNHPEKAISFHSLGQLRYLSALQFIDLVIGNSSSGIIEVPSFKIPTINIGDRQKGRVRAKSVIDCLPDTQDIQNAIKKGLSNEFKKSIEEFSSPYGNSNSSDKIYDVLRKNEFEGLLKKSFLNLDIDSI
jgi:GDP/UDP-N,N'-diacetylbacillosamine 2-epimerase (hydrolysing)